LAFFDRIIINNTIDSAAAGVYSLGYTIASLLTIITQATQIALMPEFFRFLNEKQFSRLDALIKKVFSFITFAALGLILFTDEIMTFFIDEKFHIGGVVVPIVVIGYIFHAMFTVYGRYIGYVKKTFYSSLVLILSGIFNIILNLLLIPRYGFIAGAYTTALSYLFLFLITWFVTKFILKQKITPLWAVWRPTIILLCVLAILPFLMINITNLFFLILSKLLILGLFGFIVFFRELKVLIQSKKVVV
jgi:O-antigen/teichoic acid export membrane protein